LTYGPTSALLHLVPRPGKRGLRVRARLDGGTVKVHVSRHGHPVVRARVSFASASGRTSVHGSATLKPKLALPGRFKALARVGRFYGLSKLIEIGL
jgi:hypothetical protein